MYCKNCGQIVPKGIKECPTCGEPVKSKGVIVAVLIALAAVAFAAFVTVFFFLKKIMGIHSYGCSSMMST